MKYPTHCPSCCILTANGIGGEGMEGMNKFLQALPSSHLFYEASVGHDLNYHRLGGKFGKIMADRIFLNDMLDACKSRPIWQRWFWRIQAYRNFVFVRKFGHHFFNYEGCKKAET